VARVAVDVVAAAVVDTRRVGPTCEAACDAECIARLAVMLSAAVHTCTTCHRPFPAEALAITLVAGLLQNRPTLPCPVKAVSLDHVGSH